MILPISTTQKPTNRSLRTLIIREPPTENQISMKGETISNIVVNTGESLNIVHQADRIYANQIVKNYAYNTTFLISVNMRYVALPSCAIRINLLQWHHMVQVTRKDEREANENIIRRFNRKVLQSGVLAEAKAAMRFNKDISKVERRKKAIIRKERKADKLAKARLGLR